MSGALRRLMAGRLENPPPDPMRRGDVLPFARDARTGELFLAWPRMALDVRDALTLPGDAWAGRVDPLSDEGLRRAFGLAAMMTGGAGAARSPANAIALGARRVPPTSARPRSPGTSPEK